MSLLWVEFLETGRQSNVMDYSAAVEYIESLGPAKEKPSLKRIACFLNELGDPQNKLKTFHVGGTNGKGSTATTLDALLRALGYKVGRFTGPHIFSWKERISLNGETISPDEFGRLVDRVRVDAESFASRHGELGPLSWFEFLTAMAFYKFVEAEVDFAVLEVGLGGRFDATNAADNVLGTVITNIDLEHTQILGDSVEKIAFEKAGIMKAGVPVVTDANAEALIEMRRQASLKKTNLVEREAFLQEIDSSSGDICPVLKNREALMENLALTGPHQRTNTELALISLSLAGFFKNLRAEEDGFQRMKNALSELFWPGRFQIEAEKRIIMDVAHNPASAEVLRSTLDQFRKPETDYTFVIGIYRSKDLNGFLQSLLREGDRVIACNLNTRRKFHSSKEISDAIKKLPVTVDIKEASSVQKGLEKALRLKEPGSYLVATGSFDTVRSTMTYLGWHPDTVSASGKVQLKSSIPVK